MKKTIRKSVFETNSSSMHSVCVTANDKYADYPTGILSVPFGEFGWEVIRYTSVHDKLSYVLTAIQYYDRSVYSVDDLKESMYYKWLEEMIFDYNGCVLQVLFDEKYPKDMGYIDHQSTDTLDEFWNQDKETFKANMKEFIFNKKYEIQTDNDNH